MIVVDTNTIVGLVIQADAYHALAEATRKRDDDWHTTRLYHSEFRSVAAGYLRKGEAFDSLLTAAELAAAAVTVHEPTDLEVLSIIKESPLSAYDAEFVALARRLGCKLVTTDKLVLQHYPTLAVRLQDFAA